MGWRNRLDIQETENHKLFAIEISLYNLNIKSFFSISIPPNRLSFSQKCFDHTKNFSPLKKFEFLEFEIERLKFFRNVSKNSGPILLHFYNLSQDIYVLCIPGHLHFLHSYKEEDMFEQNYQYLRKK